jgi:hypothetical protein
MEIKSDPLTRLEALLADVRKLEMYTDPKAGLDFSIGIMLAVTFDFTKAFKRACDSIRSELVGLLLKGPRVAIWNIRSPIAKSDGGSGELSAACLSLFRANDL